MLSVAPQASLEEFGEATMKPNEQYRTETAPAVACRGELSVIVPLRHGGIGGGKLAYELLGRPGAPLLIVAGGISAGRHVLGSCDFAEAGWWQSQSGSFDPSRYQILAIDWFGSNGSITLPIDPVDQVEALRQLLDHLGIAKVAAFIGASYGAMVGMHFAALLPDRLGALLAISASDRPHPFASACRALQRGVITLGERHGDMASGVALARAMAMLTYRTPDEFADRFGEAPIIRNSIVRVASEDYLAAQGERHCERMNGFAYRRLSESIDLHRIEAETIKVPLTLVAVDSDALVPADDIERMAGRLSGATLHRISSRFGHDAFLKEEAQVGAIITSFLDTLELSR